MTRFGAVRLERDGNSVQDTVRVLQGICLKLDLSELKDVLHIFVNDKFLCAFVKMHQNVSCSLKIFI